MISYKLTFLSNSCAVTRVVKAVSEAQAYMIGKSMAKRKGWRPIHQIEFNCLAKSKIGFIRRYLWQSAGMDNPMTQLTKREKEMIACGLRMLRALKKNAGMWDVAQEKAFRKLLRKMGE